MRVAHWLLVALVALLAILLCAGAALRSQGPQAQASPVLRTNAPMLIFVEVR